MWYMDNGIYLNTLLANTCPTMIGVGAIEEEVRLFQIDLHCKEAWIIASLSRIVDNEFIYDIIAFEIVEQGSDKKITDWLSIMTANNCIVWSA